MEISIAIVDDNNFLIKIVKEKLSFFKDIKINFSALNGVLCLQKLEQNPNTQIILMDIEMPELNGIETTIQIKEKYPQIKIIMLTVFDDDDNILKAIQAGADGYLLKETPAEKLHEALLQTLEGGAVMTPSIAQRTLKILRKQPIVNSETDAKLDSNLSDREIEVLEYLSKGLAYTNIAEQLFLSHYTVRKHIENIYKKLQVHSKIEALNVARKNKII